MIISTILIVLFFILIAARFKLQSPCQDPLAEYPHKRSVSPIKVFTKRTGKRYLVLGGHGLVGSHIVESLLARGETNITVFDITPSPLFSNEPNVKVIIGDIRDRNRLQDVCKDIDIVFHTAAVINFWSRLRCDYDESYQVNVIGTENVIEACRMNDIKMLIYTSSFVVVLDKKIGNISYKNESSLTYASPPYYSHYVATKIPAEQLVLAANSDTLKTVAIRPTGGVFGPRDMITTKMWKEGSNGKGAVTYFGNPDNIQDWIYVENVVHAHLLSEAKLDNEGSMDGDNSNRVDGKAYFISNLEPITYWDMNCRMSRAFQAKLIYLPPPLLFPLAYLSEIISWFYGRKWKGKFRWLTPTTLTIPRREFYFDCNKAVNELGYQAIVSFDEGVQKTVAYCNLFGDPVLCK